MPSNYPKKIRKLPDQHILIAFTEFYRLASIMSNNEKEYQKNHGIIILTAIIEQFFRSIAKIQTKNHPQKSSKLSEFNLLVIDDIINALSNRTENIPKEPISSFASFQSTDSIKIVMDKFGISAFSDKLNIAEFDELFKLRHEIIHTVNQSPSFEKDYYDITEKLMERVLNQITYTPFSFYDLKGKALQNLEKPHEEVIECFNKSVCYFANAIKKEPNAFAYYGKGKSLHELEKYSDAIACFDKAIRLDPNYAFAYTAKGESLQKLGKYREAIECFDKAIGLEPYDAFAHASKGISLQEFRKHGEAIECFDKAIGLEPNYAFAYGFKGVSLQDP